MKEKNVHSIKRTFLELPLLVGAYVWRKNIT